MDKRPVRSGPRARLVLLLLLAFVAPLASAAAQQNPGTLTNERIFASREFASAFFGPAVCSSR